MWAKYGHLEMTVGDTFQSPAILLPPVILYAFRVTVAVQSAHIHRETVVRRSCDKLYDES